MASWLHTSDRILAYQRCTNVSGKHSCFRLSRFRCTAGERGNQPRSPAKINRTTCKSYKKLFERLHSPKQCWYAFVVRYSYQSSVIISRTSFHRIHSIVQITFLIFKTEEIKTKSKLPFSLAPSKIEWTIS